MKTSFRITIVFAALMLTFAWSVTAQNLGAVVTNVLGPLATVDFSTIIPANDPIMMDPAASESASTDPPSLPRGSAYRLFGSAKNDSDQENPFNEVISFDTADASAIAGAFRILGDHVQVVMLTNQIELKYYFLGRTCGGGSPRIQLGISGDGDGNFKQFPGGPDQNAFGYLGDKAFGGGCVPQMWIHEDMTDAAPKWDLSQWQTPPAACGMTCTWDEVVTYFQTFWPQHRVLNAVLVDDSAGFFVTGRGCAYFDLVTTGPRTLTNHQDTSGSGSQPNNC